jgi:2-polyprenyl-6-methoxyphenol hydroxylase-like FAD-dependent oxidoreductase
MENAHVVIVGAGPAGLVIALALAKHQIQVYIPASIRPRHNRSTQAKSMENIVLERDREITEDPRAIYLAADAVRILYDLELGDSMPLIGHEAEFVQFHTSSFANTAYHNVNMCNDNLQQAVPAGIAQVQPTLGEELLTQKLWLTQY